MPAKFLHLLGQNSIAPMPNLCHVNQSPPLCCNPMIASPSPSSPRTSRDDTASPRMTQPSPLCSPRMTQPEELFSGLPDRPEPDAFRRTLMKLLAAHQREVDYLEEVISRQQVYVAARGSPERKHHEDNPLVLDDSSIVRSEASGIRGCPEGIDASPSPRHTDAYPSPRRSPREVSFSTEGSSSDEGEENIEDQDSLPKIAKAKFSTMAVDKADSEDDSVGQLDHGQYMWQWRRTKGGFRNYNPTQNDQIEEAYRRGLSKVRFKSGQDGQTVMEMFFVDMFQLDPKSRNMRQVRRVGAKIWYVEWGRHIQAMARAMYTGGPSWESYERYKRRQHALLGIEEGEVESGMRSTRPTGIATTVSSQCTYSEKADNVCTRITESPAFLTVSMFFTLLNVVWIGISTVLGEYNQSLWDRQIESIIIEYGFALYCVVEITLQIMSMKHKANGMLSPWFCLDAMCTVAILLEVTVAPYLAGAAGPSSASKALRLMRLLWLLKMARARTVVVTVLRGLASGMRSAADTWIIIAVLLYTCGVVLTAGSDPSGVGERYFGSLEHSITSLISHGIAMDGLSEFFNDLRLHNAILHNAIFEGLVFTIFVFLTYFGLLNMLVGTFCSVAIDTAMNDKDIGEIEYLERHLEGIVEVYMDDNCQSINNEKFQLMMKNSDVLEILKACGTDVDGLFMLAELLFPFEHSSISYRELFSVIVRCRNGKPVSVSEIIGLQEFMKQKIDDLESTIRQKRRTWSRRSSRAGSVLDRDRLCRKMTRLDAEVTPEQRRMHQQQQSPRNFRDSEEVSDFSPDESPPVEKSRSDADKIRQTWTRPSTPVHFH
ncbi:unnamed protein product [Prorocentrum cordatum]|uniref:WWE domain-containing protein n=1 Tax=Prorocentrum cordatum TaxID=2364126 RepID=A0ABN9Y7M6_9DINO|nr:unnamed protein product [Polarella glacialis]